jgi:hypothetical protein
MSIAEVIQSITNVVSDPQNTYCLGIQRYEASPAIAATPAVIAAAPLTSSGDPIPPSFAK